MAVELPPDPLFPTPSASSAVKSSDSQSLGPSASLTEMEETPEKKESDPDSPDSASSRVTRME
jgi:hypothetical protein